MLFLWDIFSQQNLGESLFPCFFCREIVIYVLWMIGNDGEVKVEDWMVVDLQDLRFGGA